MTQPNCVYVVDNDTSARNGLTRLVRTAGHDGRGFASVNEFLAALEPKASGCVVLDAGMPGLSAEEVQRELRERGIRLHIIIVTAHDDPETRSKARLMDAIGFFGKPVDSRALLNAIDWALQANCTS